MPAFARGSDTSQAAASSVASVARQLRFRVLAEIQSRGAGGLTCDEVEQILDLKHQTASARVNELMTEHLIVDSQQRRATRSGCKAVVWVAAVELTSPLKWAGGKRALISTLAKLYAPHRHRRLVEPFVGGMNVALGLRPERALLCDKNPHLINFYNRLRDPKPFTLEMRNSAHLFYAYRDCFNELIRGPAIHSSTAAELFYFLNRTCFNGLVRFNNDGKYNVPFGKYKTINYRVDFSEYAPVLSRWELRCESFDVTMMHVDGEDFIYADPPYDGTFTDYSEGGFDWDDQHRLAVKLSVHPGPVVASNAATERVLALYRDLDFNVTTIEMPRSIAASGDRQNAVEMLATKNMEV